MSTTATTMVHARVPKKLKNDAKKTLDKLGISLSLVVEQALRNIVSEKRLVTEEKPLTPTPYLEKILVESMENEKKGNKDAFSGPFTGDEFIDHLKAL